MSIIFIDKKTKEMAELNLDGNQFVITQDGKVMEQIVQDYANYSCLLERDDVEAQIIDLDQEAVVTKPCPACQEPLRVPEQFFNAVKRLSEHPVCLRVAS